MTSGSLVMAQVYSDWGGGNMLNIGLKQTDESRVDFGLRLKGFCSIEAV